MTRSIALRAAFLVYAAATAIHIGFVMAHEPFAFDAWNVAYDTHAEPFSLGRFFDYIRFEYTHSNPRIGQWFTYLAYKLEYFAPIATPIAYLGLSLAVSMLGLGRWPGGRNADGRRSLDRDLVFVAIAIGCAWFALPHIGMIMFCRAYGANYLYGAAIQLWFLVPLRLVPGGTAGRPACLAYAALGVVAGMCNEHTGPTLVAGLFAYAAWRQWKRLPAQLVWSGALGCLAGFAAIFFAPGQASRYDGLATKVSLLGRLLQRGLVSNLSIFSDWVIACAPVLGLLVIALVIAHRDALRPQLRLVGVALAAGTLITITIFVSPKLGPRFYLYGCALLLASFLAIADHTLASARRLAPFAVLAIAASAYAGFRTLPLYDRLAGASDERLAQLKAAAPGSVFTAEAFEQVDDSWWFLGDDFRDVKKRDLISQYFGLHGIIFRAVGIESPLGVSDVELVPRYQISPPGCLDEHGSFDLGSYRGIDITAVHRAALAAIERMRDRLAPAATLDKLDVVVGFTGAPPRLPRPTLLVGRWLPSGFEHYAGVIERRGATHTRMIKPPKDLPGDFDIYIYQVGDEARRLGAARDAPSFDYLPWKPGAYWALACHPAECFVIAAARVQ